MKVKIYKTEAYSTWIIREPVEIDTENYPELNGLSEQEIEEYIFENLEEMKPTDDTYYDSLDEEINDKDIRREKISGEESEIKIEFDEN
jgi:hypothetical protein